MNKAPLPFYNQGNKGDWLQFQHGSIWHASLHRRWFYKWKRKKNISMDHGWRYNRESRRLQIPRNKEWLSVFVRNHGKRGRMIYCNLLCPIHYLSLFYNLIIIESSLWCELSYESICITKKDVYFVLFYLHLNREIFG